MPKAEQRQPREVVAPGANGDPAPGAARSLADLVSQVARAEKRRRRLERDRAAYAHRKDKINEARRKRYQATRQNRTAYARQQHAKNPHAQNARARRYYARNAEARREYSRKRYAHKRDEILQRRREHYQANRAEVLAKKKADWHRIKCRELGLDVSP